MTGGVAVLVPAAGGGTRLGRGPKAFVPLAGRTLLEHVMAGMAGVADEIVVALPDAYGAGASEPALRERASVRARIIAGGATRQESVSLLLAATEAEWVLVHDVARPLAPRALALRVLAAAREHGAATAAVPVVDTLHDTERERPVSREALMAIQTPQGFSRSLLLRAHAHARAHGVEAGDDAQLVRALGAQVELVPGSPWAHKLTGPDDLAFLEALARAASAVADDDPS